MTRAVIDIGTNTLILLVAKPKGKKKIKVLHDEAVITRLGQGLGENHFFMPEAMNRTMATLAGFKKTCDKMKVKKITAVGTAACRTAANAGVFTDSVKKEHGIRVEIISPENEATLTFAAVWHDFGKKGEKFIVADIGGGSTEIITGPLNDKKNNPETELSLAMGSVRLTEQYITTDPISREEFARLHMAIRNGLADELDGFYPKTTDFTAYRMIATAGTATTLSAINKKMAVYAPGKIHGSILKKKDLEKIIEVIAGKTLHERQKIPGLEPLRADVILAGALLLNEIMRYFKQTETIVSDRGLRYGVFYKKFM